METEALPGWFTDLLAHRRWIRRTRPFPHIYVRDVFVPQFHRLLTEQLEQARADSPAELPLTALPDGPLALFLSRPWHDLITRVSGVETCGDVEGSLQHHAANSPRGRPRHGLSPAWFPARPPAPGAVGLPDPAIEPRTGARPDGMDARELVRAVAVLFHLGNPPWRPGDGGETGLFAESGGRDQRPTVIVPPLDNSMLVFECTPRSWHSFLGANAAARTSVAMWLHQPRKQAAHRWGGDRVAEW